VACSVSSAQVEHRIAENLFGGDCGITSSSSLDGGRIGTKNSNHSYGGDRVDPSAARIIDIGDDDDIYVANNDDSHVIQAYMTVVQDDKYNKIDKLRGIVNWYEWKGDIKLVLVEKELDEYVFYDMQLNILRLRKRRSLHLLPRTLDPHQIRRQPYQLLSTLVD